MKLLFKQRLFSWFDSYDIYDEAGDTAYIVRGKMAWGHRFDIFDRYDQYVGRVKEKMLRMLPSFEFSIGEQPIGEIRKELTFLRPKYTLRYNGWTVSGNMMGWDYQIFDANGAQAAAVSKQLFRMTDTYIIDIPDPQNALTALMIVLSIDAANCTR